MANPTGSTYHIGEHRTGRAGGVGLVYKDPDWEARTARLGVPGGARRLGPAPAATGLLSRHPLLALLGALAAGVFVARLTGCRSMRAD